jgi:predicted RNA methylase
MNTDFNFFKNLSQESLERVYKLQNNIDPKYFKGEVLHVGMGTCYLPLLQTSKATHTTIVEIDPDIIQYNKDKIKNNWTIIQEDAYNFFSTLKYDIIMLDIWYRPVEQVKVFNLVEKYKNFLKPTGKVLYLKGLIKPIKNE